MRPERRASRRLKMVLPVKVSLVSGNALAHTMDVSSAGARLGGVRDQLQPGEIISLARGLQKARFRIIWVQQVGVNELQVGIEALQPQENFWGVDLSGAEREARENVDMLMTLLKGERRHQ